GTTGAEDYCRSRALLPIGRRLREMSHEAVGVGVLNTHLPILQPDRIGGPDRISGWQAPVGCLVGNLFQWNSDVAAGKTVVCQSRQKCCSLIGVNSDLRVLSRDAILI